MFLTMQTKNEIKSHTSHRLAEKLQVLLDIAQKVKKSRSKLHALYVEWSNITKTTAESLLKIREVIIDHTHNSNIASLTGTSTAIIGSCISIFGLVFAIPSAGLSLALTAGGAATATLGGTIAVGSVIAKNVLSRRLCKKAKKVFLKNISLTESLEMERGLYFKLLDRFKNEMEGFSDEDVLAEFSQLVCIFSEDFDLDENVRTFLPPTSIKMDAINPRDVEQRDLLINLSKLLKLIKQDPFLKILFYDSTLWKNVLHEAIRLLAPDVDLGKVFSKGSILHGPAGCCVLAGAIKAGQTLKDIFKGMSITFRIGISVLNSIFVIWGIVDLVMTSIDVYNGSTSNESEELLRVAEDLKEYREEVTNIVAITFGWNI